jgi:hypothetical protein
MHRIMFTGVLLAVACLVGSVAEAVEFSVRDVDGPMAFAFDGFATVGTSTVPAASIGRFIADGRSNLTDGVRTLVVGGTTVHQTFTCTYTVNADDGTGSASCVVTPGGPETFDFVIVEKKKEAFFTATTPGVTIRGVSRRQH